MMRLIFSMWLLAAVNATGFGQEDKLIEMAIDHFGKPDARSIWWLKDLSGFFDQTHEVRMVLATDNTVFKGAYEIKSSGEKFYLDGNYDGDQIILVETDSLGRTTGIIKGDMNDDEFYAEWSDPKNTIQLPINLSAAVSSPNPCGNIGWVHTFSVKGPDSLKTVTVWKYEESIQLSLSYSHVRKIHDMECNDSDCKQLTHLTEDLEDQIRYELDLDKFHLMAESEQKDILYELKPVKSMYFDCLSYMDFDDKFSLVFPVSSSEKFNNWVRTAWSEKYGFSGREIKKQQNIYSVSDRISHEEYGGVLIDYFDEKLFSGIFFIQSSKYPATSEIPFQYAFGKDKAFSVEDIFAEGVDGKAILLNEIAEKKKSRAEQDEYPQFSASDYSVWTINEEGIICRTSFSTIYGRDSIVIEKQKLKPFVRKNIAIAW